MSRGWARLRIGAAVFVVAACAAMVVPGLAAASSARLQLVLPLRVHARALKRLAEQVTDPASPRYDQFRSIASLSRQFGASPAERRQVLGYLRAHGASDARVDATGVFVEARMRPARAASLFHTELADHTVPWRRPFLTAAAPAVPAALRGAVTGVVGLSTQPLWADSDATTAAATTPQSTTAPAAPSTTGSGYMPASGTPSGCKGALHMNAAKVGESTGFAPDQYLTAYDYNALHQQGYKGQGERVALIEIDGFRAADIDEFASCFNLAKPNVNAYGVGISQALPAGSESELDLEVLDAAAPRLKGIDVYETEPDAPDVLMALTAPMQNRGRVPQVISASLGLCEQDTRAAVGSAGLQASSEALEIASLSGISVLGASGDDGSSDCIDPQSDNPILKLAVNYPASSRWVTAVGGTNLELAADNTISGQVVWNDGSEEPGYASGGGVSMLSGGLPGYQHGVVSGSHRELPDVSLLADVAPGYDVYCTVPGQEACRSLGWQTFGGTSAATPLMAGGVALIDQQLRADKKQSLGLINPLLYKLGRDPADAANVFDDVTVGSNDVGPFMDPARTLKCCSAAAGFDDASGWGAVNLAELAQFALQLTPGIVHVTMALQPHQHPVRAHAIYTKVTCSGKCVMGAYARVMIGGVRRFAAYSAPGFIRNAGAKTVKIGFTAKQLKELRAALATNRQITATVVGAIIDAGGNIERKSPAVTLAITS